MDSAEIIRIPNPSKELVAFLEETQKIKSARMKAVCDKYRRLLKN